MRDSRLEKLADVLVNYSVGVKRDQLVRVKGPPATQPLIVELYRKILAAGGHPMLRMTPEELDEIIVKHGNDEQLKYLNPVEKFELETVDAYIGIWGEENTRALTNCDPKKLGCVRRRAVR
jgi:aminopeptidase